MPNPLRITYAFEDFRLDTQEGRLMRLDADGTPAFVPLGSRALEILFLLVERSGEVVSKAQIMDTVWPGLAVEENNLTVQVSALRRALAAGRVGPSLIQTIPARGYRLAAEATRMNAAQPAAPILGPDLGPNCPIAGPYSQSIRSSLVVLPFANLSDDRQQDYFADGIAEELTTALSRVRWFSVIARTSASTYKGRAVDVRQIGRELGIRYLLEGSVRQANGCVRITCQLIEAETGQHVWAERFDGDLGDIFTLQDRVAEAVAGAVEPSLERAEIERVRAKPTADLDAYDLYLRSLTPFFTMTERGCAEALALLRQATVRDPDFLLARAHILACLTRRVAQGWGVEGDREEGIRLVEDIHAVNSTDPLTLVCVVHALGLLARDAARALDVARRALALNPNSVWVQSAAGWAYAWACDPAASAAHFTRAIELDPRSVDLAFSLAGLARAHLMAGRPNEALSLAEQALREMPACAAAHRLAIAALSCLGRLSDAIAAAERFRASLPGAACISADSFRRLYRDQGFVETLILAWRASGLPE